MARRSAVFAVGKYLRSDETQMTTLEDVVRNAN